MLGTLRAFTAEDEKMMIERIKQIATKTAEAEGATAEVKIPYSTHYPVTYNDPALTEKMAPSLLETAGAGNLLLKPPVTGAEDFSFYQQKVPGIFIFLGGMPKGGNPSTAPSHHTPDFYIDESGFSLGAKALCNLTLDYMAISEK
jgi:amidohydrolase